MCIQVKKNYEALRQRQEEECVAQSSPSRGREEHSTSKWEKESQEATRELLKLKDRLIEVERNVCTRSSAPSELGLGEYINASRIDSELSV